jgi:hypothetical protein
MTDQMAAKKEAMDKRREDMGWNASPATWRQSSCVCIHVSQFRSLKILMRKIFQSILTFLLMPQKSDYCRHEQAVKHMLIW